MDFETLGLSQTLISALSTRGITQPTDVQALTIPLMLSGKDGIVQSKTGSGKTLSYLLPLFQMLEGNQEKSAQAIIVVPTKELAMQIHHEVQWLADASQMPLRSAVLFGNVNINSQIDRLKAKPQIIIGTCDRILALIQKKKVAAHTVKTFIVDEADKLLEDQSISMLKSVRKTCMKNTQTIFVSATYLPRHIKQALTIAPQAETLRTQEKTEIPPSITHQYLVCDSRDKLDNLRRLIRILEPKKSLIFINDLSEINLAVEKLTYHGLDCACIHSGTTKEERKHRLTAFRDGKLTHLVATDLAARGLHVDEIPCIFHLSIAEEPIDYLHRAGRTGRNNAPGQSISIAAPHEVQFLAKCRSRFSITMEEIYTKENKLYHGTPPAK